ncbi:ABC transporter ATP-binding protein [Streptococcus equinus]|nr:ABC transporter ATP-binding protein [Streptococcus equinus]
MKQQLINLKKTIHLIKKIGNIWVIISVILSIIQGILPTIGMIITQTLLNSITSTVRNIKGLVFIFILYVLYSLLTTGITELQEYVDSKLQIVLRYKMNYLLMEKTSKMSLMQFEIPETYNKITRIQNQISYKPFQIYQALLNVVTAFTIFFSAITVLIMWKLSLFPLLVVLPIISIIIYLKIGKNEFNMLYKRSSDERKIWYVSHLLTHDFSVKELRIGKLSDYFLNKYKNINNLFINQEMKINKSKMFYSVILGVIETAINGFVVFTAVSEAYTGQLMIGNVTTLIRSLALLQSSTQNIVNNVYSFYNGSCYMELLYDFISECSPIAEDTDNEKYKIRINKIDNIELKNVSFAYFNQKTVLKDISFSLSLGERVAIVGKNGSGKSTIFKLLCGLYDNYQGEILVNGIELRKIDKSSYFDKISVLFQDFLKYELTLRENIGLGDISNINDDNLLTLALSKVGLKEYFTDKTENVNFELQLGNWFDNGRQLSGGQWQKIALARVYLKSASFYLLDEPSSALDPISESQIFKSFFELSRDRIGIFITHKPSITKNVDKILFVKDGKIKSEGNFKYLLSTDVDFLEFVKTEVGDVYD